MKGIATALVQLQDGRMQAFAVDLHNDVWTRWKATTKRDADWSPWQRFNYPQKIRSLSGVLGQISTGEITGHPLVHLVGIDMDDNIVTCWKGGNAFSPWTSWVLFEGP